MRKIYVLGADGYIGSSFISTMREGGRAALSIGRRSEADLFFDLNDPDTRIASSLERGSLVLVAAAVSNPDACEKDFEKAWQVNVVGTSAFIDAAIQRNCDVVFLSSDAVFASEPDVVYDEGSEVSPRFAYGKMKAEIERRFGGDERFKTLRLSYVFSNHDKVMTYMLGCARRGEVAEIFHPYFRSYIALSDVVRAISALEANWSLVPDWRLNLAGVELVSRARVADELGQLLPSFEYEVTLPPESFFNVRPRVTHISSNYLYALGVCQPDSFSKKFRREMEGVLNND